MKFGMLFMKKIVCGLYCEFWLEGNEVMYNVRMHAERYKIYAREVRQHAKLYTIKRQSIILIRTEI